MFRDSRHHAQAHGTFGQLTYRALCLVASWKKTAGDFAGQLVVAAVEPRHICCGRIWPSNQTGGVAILASSSLLDQIPHQVKSQTSEAIFRHTRRQESSWSVTPSQYQFFAPKSGGMSLLLGRGVPHKFILRFSKSSESLGHEQTTVRKHFAPYTFSSAKT